MQKMSVQLTAQMTSLEENLNVKIQEFEYQVAGKFDNLQCSSLGTSSANREEKSYAHVTSASSQTRLFVKPKDKDQDIKITKGAILKKVDPVKLDIKVVGVKPARDGGVIIGCDSIADSKKMLMAAQNQLPEKYDVREMHGVLPSVRLVGLSEKFEPETVVHYLRAQNERLFAKDSICNVVKIEPLKNKNTIFFVLLKVDRSLYHKLLEKGHVLLGLDSCSVYDFLQLAVIAVMSLTISPLNARKRIIRFVENVQVIIALRTVLLQQISLSVPTV